MAFKFTTTLKLRSYAKARAEASISGFAHTFVLDGTDRETLRRSLITRVQAQVQSEGYPDTKNSIARLSNAMGTTRIGPKVREEYWREAVRMIPDAVTQIMADAEANTGITAMEMIDRLHAGIACFDLSGILPRATQLVELAFKAYGIQEMSGAQGDEGRPARIGTRRLIRFAVGTLPEYRAGDENKNRRVVRLPHEFVEAYNDVALPEAARESLAKARAIMIAKHIDHHLPAGGAVTVAPRSGRVESAVNADLPVLTYVHDYCELVRADLRAALAQVDEIEAGFADEATLATFENDVQAASSKHLLEASPIIAPITGG